MAEYGQFDRCTTRTHGVKEERRVVVFFQVGSLAVPVGSGTYASGDTQGAQFGHGYFDPAVAGVLMVGVGHVFSCKEIKQENDPDRGVPLRVGCVRQGAEEAPEGAMCLGQSESSACNNMVIVSTAI